MRSLSVLSVSLLLGCSASALAADDEPAPSPAPAAAPAIEERVVVSATRLPDDTQPIEDVPSHVTVIDR